jgi:hypothetical protein
MSGMNWDLNRRKRAGSALDIGPKDVLGAGSLKEPKKKPKARDFINMRAKYDSDCATCDNKIVKGEPVRFYVLERYVVHYGCKRRKNAGA